MKKALTLSTLASLALPMVTFAAINNISDVGSFIIDTINGIFVPVLFSVAFIVFVWGAFKTFILGANSADVKKQGTNLMMYGLIGFFVMVSVWGIVNVLTGSISFGDNSGPTGGLPSTGFGVDN